MLTFKFLKCFKFKLSLVTLIIKYNDYIIDILEHFSTFWIKILTYFTNINLINIKQKQFWENKNYFIKKFYNIMLLDDDFIPSIMQSHVLFCKDINYNVQNSYI